MKCIMETGTFTIEIEIIDTLNCERMGKPAGLLGEIFTLPSALPPPASYFSPIFLALLSFTV